MKPHATTINPFTDDLEQEYADAKGLLSVAWMKRMGWAEWL
ncbi:hypothetical protein [Mucilaginibacter sp. 21P]|nr:hypothetical protein [Mucilaginibacter sp. 21P]